MKLRRLHIATLPGIRPGFELDGLGDGIHIVAGPNASGKSSIIRAVRHLIDPTSHPGRTIHLEADVETAGGLLRVVRTGNDTQWFHAGQPVDPPPLPEQYLLGCYTLQLEDLTDAGETEADISHRLVRDLAGGFDLGALTAEGGPFRLKRNHGEAEAQRRATAAERLRQRQHEHRERIDKERSLDALRDELAGAEAARTRAERLRRAADLAGVRERLAEIDAALAGFPEGMERLHGDEADRLGALRREREELATQLQEARDRLEQHREALARTGLTSPTDRTDRTDPGDRDSETGSTAAGGDARSPGEPVLDNAALEEQSRALDRLHDLENDVRRAEHDAEAARQRRREAAADLGSPPEGPLPRITPDVLREVEDALAPRRAAAAERAAVEAELERFATAAETTPPPADTVREARRALIAWLAAPAAPTPGRGAAVAAGLGAAALLALAAAAAVAHPIWLAVAAAALAGLGYAAFTLLRRGDGDGQRAAARDRYAATGLTPPTAWTPAAALQRVEELDRLLATAEQEARREELARRRQRLHDTLQRHDAALADRAAEFGFDPGALDTEVHRYLQRLLAWDQARAELNDAETRVRLHHEEAATLRAGVTTFLLRWGESPEADEASEGLRAAWERLRRRLQQRDEAIQWIDDLNRQVATLERQIAGKERQLDQLFAGAGLPPGDEAALHLRLERLEAWRQHTAERNATSQNHDALRRALADHPDLLARAEKEDAAALHDEARRDDETAARIGELSADIRSIEDDIRRAGKERPLEAARAEDQAAEDALAERLDEALVARAGAWLIDDVRAEHTAEHRPAALRRAEAWFDRFTHHRYRLRFAAGEGPGGPDEGRFLAHDTEAGEDRPLAALSTGTRMQLLLAVRIAFALEAERGREALPLFLDEALTTADPERFRAVADALETLAAEDERQVFYLTAQETDIGLWRADERGHRVIDLGRLRRLTDGATTAGDLAAPEPTDVPAPEGLTPEAYGAALHVPPIRPWDGAGAIHLFHLLRDDLLLLHHLLETGIERLGPLRGLLDGGAATALLDPRQRDDLATRGAVAEAWIEGYRTGRGRPIDRITLAGADPIAASTHRDLVAALADEHGGDAAAIVAALEGKAVKGFRKLPELTAWLEAHGHLDRRPPSTRDERVQHALAAAAGALEAKTVEAASIRRWVAWLEAGAGIEEEAPAA